MKIDNLRSVSFYYKINNSNKGIACLDIPVLMDVFQYFDTIQIYDFGNNYLSQVVGLDRIISIIEQTLDDGQIRETGGGEEAYFEIGKKWTKLHLTLPIMYNIYEVDTTDFHRVLTKYRNWLNDLESCQIPGVIPASKLDTWTCVPKEYVKPEWWEQQKDQKNGA